MVLSVYGMPMERYVLTQLVTDVSGTPTTTTDTSTHANYLTNTAAEDLQTLTVNDYTFICNRNRNVAYTT